MDMHNMQNVYLSRRNLLALLSKLDRAKNGEDTLCTIIKNDTVHPKYPCSDVISITVVEDEEYYKERAAGALVDADEANVKSQSMKFLKIGEVFFHHDLEDGWYSLYIDGKKHREYNHYFDLKEDAKALDISLIWGKDQNNYYCPDELKGKLL